MATKDAEWLVLQRKIFSRWVSQKLWISHHIKVTDVVDDISKDPLILIYLTEVLSEKKFNGKLEKVSRMRVQQLANFNTALHYIFGDCGLVMKIKPSAEDCLDKNERSVLGLLFSIMMKFLKFGDDEESDLNAKDALLLWVKNKTQGYDGVTIESFAKSFHSGLALCALVHKHRPKLIDYNALDKADKLGCIKAAMVAAEKYFALEQYITPQEFTKLDEASMVVYVSEYYYGIAEQRKLDQAARRLHKVIKFTKTCDKLRAEFKDSAQQFKDRLTSVEKVLQDRTIDNTMAGARAKIEEFYAYKTNDKGVIIGLQLNLEGLYNNLAMLLSHNKRPEFVPPAGLTLKDIEAAVSKLEVVEQERKVALHAELNRQIKLVQLNDYHTKIFDKLQGWISIKDAYLSKKELIESVGAARFSIATLDSYDHESKDVQSHTVVDLKKLGAELRQNKYENQHDVDAREAAIDASFKKLTGLSNAKRPVLEDDLARELYKEALRIQASQHKDKYEKLCSWVEAKKTYLSTHEEVHSVPEAHLLIGLLDASDKDQTEIHESSVKSLKKLGAEILNAQYSTQYSSYKYHLPNEITDAEEAIDSSFAELTQLSGTKKQYFDQCLKREIHLEELRVEFAQVATEYTRWVKDATENLEMAHFGFDLEEVEKYREELDKNEQELDSQNGAHQQKYTALWDQVKDLVNPYTELKIDDLSASGDSLAEHRQQRISMYETELARQQANDALCKKFAGIADPFSQWIIHQKDTITHSRAPLKEQLAFVDERLHKQKHEGSKLSDTDSLQKQIDEAGVTNNKHTLLTAKDLNVQWQMYTHFLDKKKKMLEVTIEHEERRGISAEQFKEIDDNWKQFAKNECMDLKALRTCLYSLGEEVSKEGLNKILAEYGEGGKIVYAGYRKFMLHLFGDTDTKEEVVNGWILIARGDDFVSEDKMNAVMQDEDVSYVKEHGKKEATGYDYKGWTDWIFSR